MPRLSPPMLMLLTLFLAAPASAQRSGGGGYAPSSPANLTQRFEKAAGRSAIPQPGEGFPKALVFETEAPVKVPFAREGEVIPWQKAVDYLGGDRIVVQGRVVDAFQIPNGPCLIKFDADDRSAFVIAAFTRDWPAQKDAPENLYRGRVVRVTGVVTAYKGNPQMKVDDPSQIEIVGG